MRVIGQRINPSGRPRFQAELARGSLATVLKEAGAQSRAGADALDVNVGEGPKDEAAMMAKALRAIRKKVGLPLWVDSRHPEVLRAGLRACRRGDFLNSVSEHPEFLALLPAASRKGMGVVVHAAGKSVRERMQSVRRVAAAALKAGIPRERLLVDCLAMPRVLGPGVNRTTLAMIGALRKEGLASLLALSNVSYGRKRRARVEAAFLKEAQRRGLDACILDPLRSGFRR